MQCLKVMLIALITVGLILFLLLLICSIMTCCKRKRPNNRTLVGMGLVSNKLVANQRTMDRRAMIQETSSETSDDTHTLPYDRNKVRDRPLRTIYSLDDPNNFD